MASASDKDRRMEFHLSESVVVACLEAVIFVLLSAGFLLMSSEQWRFPVGLSAVLSVHAFTFMATILLMTAIAAGRTMVSESQAWLGEWIMRVYLETSRTALVVHFSVSVVLTALILLSWTAVSNARLFVFTTVFTSSLQPESTDTFVKVRLVVGVALSWLMVCLGLIIRHATTIVKLGMTGTTSIAFLRIVYFISVVSFFIQWSLNDVWVRVCPDAVAFDTCDLRLGTQPTDYAYRVVITGVLGVLGLMIVEIVANEILDVIMRGPAHSYLNVALYTGVNMIPFVLFALHAFQDYGVTPWSTIALPSTAFDWYNRVLAVLWLLFLLIQAFLVYMQAGAAKRPAKGNKSTNSFGSGKRVLSLSTKQLLGQGATQADYDLFGTSQPRVSVNQMITVPLAKGKKSKVM